MTSVRTKAGGGDALLAGKLTALLMLPEFNGLRCTRPQRFSCKEALCSPRTSVRTKAGGGDALLAGKLTALLMLPEFNGLRCIRPQCFSCKEALCSPLNFDVGARFQEKQNTK